MTEYFPSNRQLKKLWEVAEIITWTTPSKGRSDFWWWDVPFVKPPNLWQVDPIFQTEECLTNIGLSKAKQIPTNAIMVCCIWSLGKVWIAWRELCTNQQINSVVFDSSQVFFRYGYYFCTTLEEKMKKIANQAVVQIINKSQFSQIQIPLPPLEEQKKIVAYLDELNATISKLKSEYQSQLAMLDEMRNSSIDLAFWGSREREREHTT